MPSIVRRTTRITKKTHRQLNYDTMLVYPVERLLFKFTQTAFRVKQIFIASILCIRKENV